MGKLELKFTYTDILNLGLYQLKDMINYLTIIFDSLDKYDFADIKRLPTESFPIHIGNSKNLIEYKYKPNEIKDWLIRKGLEDIIIGLTKSLRKALFLIELSKINEINTIFKSELDAKKVIISIDKEISKNSFPTLINKIETLLNLKVDFKEEILSINNLRNEMVHREQINSEIMKIIKLESNEVILKWFELKFLFDVNGKFEELNYELRKKCFNPNKMTCGCIRKEKKINKDENIEIDINILNGIVFTCIEFLNHLYDNIKGSIKELNVNP